MRLGVDAGGTFTDFIVLHDDGRIESFKLRSNPRDPAGVILAGVRRAAGNARVEVVHGSTVATNALLERKGARTAFVTTRGFEDLLFIGRQNRAELYNLAPAPRRHLVERRASIGVDERAHYDGSIERRPSAGELARLRRRLARLGVRSVAVCLLHSYRNPENERAVARALAGDRYLCASHEVSPEFREYERASTTVINAYVGPLMDAYLAALERDRRRRFWIMQSNGGSLTASEARRQAVRTVLSGPAGGLVAAVEMGRRAGFERVLGFDMGGTSTDVSLSDGRPLQTTEAYIDGFPIRVPMLDIHTVGAGGGSIARVDEGGLLRVGPESAGADPGPACYGKGELATVTDAHVVLGRIGASQFLGGEMKIDPRRSEAAVDRIARALRVDRVAAAAGILRVANAGMERAIRAVSIERGHDPRRFTLVAFGGCGGLHACDLAAALGIRTILVPRYAEGLSALGMLLADRVRDYAAGVLGRPDPAAAFPTLERRARRENPGARIERFADVRYSGQSYELTVPWSSGRTEKTFHEAHRRAYGYASPDRPVEVVTVRVRARQSLERPRLSPQPPRDVPRGTRDVWVGRWQRIPVCERGHTRGPALILDYGSTTLLSTGWNARRDRIGNLVIEAKKDT
jgi:N-methylhydantoinase A